MQGSSNKTETFNNITYTKVNQDIALPVLSRRGILLLGQAQRPARTDEVKS
jgi:hypothetical protein